jgi:hypothetical protein
VIVNNLIKGRKERKKGGECGGLLEKSSKKFITQPKYLG